MIFTICIKAALLAVINRTTAKCEAATNPTPTPPLSGDSLSFIFYFFIFYLLLFYLSHPPLVNNTLILLRKHMKVHGKDAVCQFDSSESDDEEESSAASPSSSLVSATPSYLRPASPSTSSHGQGVPTSQPDWYLYHIALVLCFPA